VIDRTGGDPVKLEFSAAPATKFAKGSNVNAPPPVYRSNSRRVHSPRDAPGVPLDCLTAGPPACGSLFIDTLPYRSPVIRDTGPAPKEVNRSGVQLSAAWVVIGFPDMASWHSRGHPLAHLHWLRWRCDALLRERSPPGRQRHRPCVSRIAGTRTDWGQCPTVLRGRRRAQRRGGNGQRPEPDDRTGPHSSRSGRREARLSRAVPRGVSVTSEPSTDDFPVRRQRLWDKHQATVGGEIGGVFRLRERRPWAREESEEDGS